MREIVAYTDGGCRGNPGGIGAWAYLLVDRATGRALEAATRYATNSRVGDQRAKRVAGAEGRSPRLRPKAALGDSKYTIDCGSKWIAGWKRLGWKRSTGPLENVDLLQELDRRFAPHSVEWRWVPGHAGEPGNERVDLLVNEAMDRMVGRGEQRWERRTEWKVWLPWRWRAPCRP